ncbi:alpha/beta fold hydrolase [Aquincola sp. S2]|uniref:Alpha/beta fold hydrolase n=1 Tax=Pseudaquabacterium terrae TaxID=2732868 RepID=A0ABX2EMP0_9BURK|nr:alpha/beta fold hydrolase [Aquabacterium terrae]NRF69832.1 alpha/beta fold hydrolase [Aquabacterium terrae]
MRVQANGLEFEVDDQGPPNGEPLLLIMGLGMQLIAWPDELVADLVGRGFRVIRLDNRDIGLSSHLDHLGVPSLVKAALRHALHLKVRSPYPMSAMADDALGVLDALGIARAHVCGASMGGMIAQHLAARHPQRVASLTLLMTSSGARHLPQPRMAVRQALMTRPRGPDLEAKIAHYEHLFHVIGSPAYRPDPQALRQRLERSVRRSYHPAGVVRQMVAIAADGDRSPLLRDIQAPTHVIHGEDDPLVPVGAAHDLLQKISGASRDLIPGMGHDLPQQLLPRLAAGMAMNAARV